MQVKVRVRIRIRVRSDRNSVTRTGVKKSIKTRAKILLELGGGEIIALRNGGNAC